MNTLRFKQHPLAVATKTLVFGACAAVLFGCGSDDRTEEDHSVDNTDNSVVQAPATTIDTGVDGSQLTGTVSGSVRDTNGAPVEGATVVLNGAEKQTATTDASGYYSFKDVVVTGLDRDSDNGFADQISVSVMANGFASATSSVSPVAASENTDGGTNSQIIVDNFVSTANVVIPKMESSVVGNLRLETGEPAVGVTVKLDFTGLSTNTNTQTEVVDSSSVGFPTVQVVTDAEGNFTFVNLPADSMFELHVDGYTHAPQSVETKFDAAQHIVGKVTVKPYTSTDNVQPYLVDMPQVVGDNGRGVLAADVDGTDGITFTFSEPMQAVAAENVFVYSVTKSAYLNVASITMSADARSMTLTLDDAIAAEEKFNILVLTSELADAAGNGLDKAKTKEPLVQLGVNADRGDFTEIKLQGFIELNTNSNVVLTQVFSVAEADVTAFEDSVSAAGIQQLNSGNSADSRLKALLAAQNKAMDVNTATALIKVELVEGAKYDARLIKANGTVTDIEIGVKGTKTFTIDNASPGDVVSVQSYDDFGHKLAAPATLTIKDAVPATVALQESYGLGSKHPLVVTAGTTLDIDGGQHLDGENTDAVIGSPIIHVSPRLLAGTETAWQGAEGVAATGVFGGLTTGDDDLDDNAYAAAQWSAFAARAVSAQIGVAFTEQVTVTGNPTWAGAAALTGFTAVSDNQNNSDFIGDGQNFDGISLNVSNVLTLAADARTANNQIDFTGDVTDTAGNVSAAADQAMVAFADAIPPFVTKAVMTPEAFTVTFNEAIDGNKNTLKAMTIDGVALSNYGDDEITVNGAVATFANTKITPANLGALVAKFSDAEVVDGVDGADDAFDFNEGTVLRGHAYLDFSGISDVGSASDRNIGVSWADYKGGEFSDGTKFNLAMTEVPKFLAANEIAPFAIASTDIDGLDDDGTAGADDDAKATITITFNHPIDLGTTGLNVLDSDGDVEADELKAVFTLDGAALADDSKVAINNARTRITVTLEEADDSLSESDVLASTRPLQSSLAVIDPAGITIDDELEDF